MPDVVPNVTIHITAEGGEEDADVSMFFHLNMVYMKNLDRGLVPDQGPIPNREPILTEPSHHKVWRKHSFRSAN